MNAINRDLVRIERSDGKDITTPISPKQFDIYADYEGHEVPGQCGSIEATSRLQQLLVPGTTVWLEIDETGFNTMYVLSRHVWIQLDGKYRLLAEVLVTEGMLWWPLSCPAPAVQMQKRILLTTPSIETP